MSKKACPFAGIIQIKFSGISQIKLHGLRADESRRRPLSPPEKRKESD